LKQKQESEEWKADPELTMTLSKNFTKKDWIFLSSFLIIVTGTIVGLKYLFTGVI